MRVMVLVKASEKSEAGEMPTEQNLMEMNAYNEELVKAGIMLAGEGLHPTSKGKRVVFDSDNKTSVVDGPFTETKELLAGFWLWEVKNMDEAIEWARRMPNPAGEPCHVEVRQVFTADDFGDAMTPELRESEDRMREQYATKG